MGEKCFCRNLKFQCNICQMVFTEKESYHRHNLLMHRDKIISDNIFSCMHCDKQFTTKPALDEHLEKLHTSDSIKVWLQYFFMNPILKY